MSSGRRSNEVCRTCLSTDGEFISIFSETCNASQVTKKIMSISRVLMDKKDGLPDKICRKCIYLVESFHCFKKQLVSADKRLRQIWEHAEEEHLEMVFQNQLASVESRDTERIELASSRIEDKEHKVPAPVRSNFTEHKVPAPSQSKNIEQEFPAPSQSEDIEQEVSAPSQSEDTEQNNIVPDQKEEPENDELDYDIEWISDKVKIAVERAFRKKWANAKKMKLEESQKALKNVEDVEDFSPRGLEIETIKTEKPEDCLEDDIVKSGGAEESVGNEVIKSENLACSIKKEPIGTEELNCNFNSDKSDDENTAKDAKEQKNSSNVIVISDSSDEADCPNVRRKALSTLPTDSSGVVGNRNVPLNSQRGRKKIVRTRALASGKKVDSKKESPSLKTGSAPTSNSKAGPRKYFQCTRCNVNLFTVAAVLLHHNQVHTPDKASLCCRMCDKTFPAKSELFAHFNQHVESHLFRCSHCPNEFVLKKNLTEHMKSHKKRALPAEPKSPQKRARVDSETLVENYLELKQNQDKKNLSAESAKASEASEENEKTVTTNLQIAVAENLDKNAKHREEDPGQENSIAANLQIPVALVLDNNPVDQDEEDSEKVNSTTVNSAVPEVASADKNFTEQEEEEEVAGNENRITPDFGIPAIVHNPDNSFMDQE